MKMVIFQLWRLMVMKKKRTSIFNAPMAGLSLAIISNVLVVAMIAILNRYSSINTRYYVIGVLVSILLILLANIFFLLGYVKRKKSFRVVFVFFSLFLSLVLSLGTWYTYRGSTSIDKIINDMGMEDLEYSLISLDPSITLNFLNDEKIAIVKDEYSKIESEVKETLSDYSESLEYIDYNTYRNLLFDAQDNEYSLMVVPSDFRKLLDNPQDEMIFKDSEVLLTFNTQQEEDVSDVDVLKDPFTILMLGNNEGLSDSIIVASFNPTTLRATMTSLARDSYVPIACYPYGSRDKLNHSRAHSRQCTIDTIEDFLDIEIDFYFETDFYALVKTVDTVGGLEIESPVSFAGTLPIENKIGETETVYIEEGKHLLDGKQAITFARERHHMPNGDFDRQLNQQYVIRELASKIMATRNIETLMDVLDVGKDNMVMNIPIRSLSALMGYSMDQINLSPVDGLDAFRIVQTQVAGTTPLVEGASVVMPYLKDIEQSSQLINDNVSTKLEKNNVTHFTFSYLEPYKLDLSNPNLAGGGRETYGGDSLFTVPSFDGWALSEIQDWGAKRGITIIVEKIESDNPGVLITQNPKEGTLSSKPSEIYIKYQVEKEEEIPEVQLKTIVVPDLRGENISAIQTWVQKAKEELGEDVITYQIKKFDNGEGTSDEILGQNIVGEQSFKSRLEIVFEVNTYKAENNENGDEEALEPETGN